MRFARVAREGVGNGSGGLHVFQDRHSRYRSIFILCDSLSAGALVGAVAADVIEQRTWWE